MGQKLPIYLFFFVWYANGQDSNVKFKSVTIDQGLSQNSVVDIAQDELGFMWFATQDGLNRYDGKNFKVFPEFFDDITSPHFSQLGKLFANNNKLWLITKGGKLKVMDLCTENVFSVDRLSTEMDLLPPVSTVFEDTQKDLWIGTVEDGVFHWNPVTNSFERFFVDHSTPFNLAGNKVRSIFKDSKANVWILTNNGLNSIGSEGNKGHLIGTNTNVICQDMDEGLWLGTFGEGIFYKEANSLSFQQVRRFGEDYIPEDLVVEAIHADRVGNIWIGTYGSGLYLLHKGLNRIFHYMPDRRNPFSIGFQDILSIQEDKEGGIWIGTDGGGVSYYNPHFQNFKRVTDREVSEEISIKQIRAITTDKDEGIWLGTSGKGLTYLSADLRNRKTFHLKPFHEGIANYDRIISLLSDDDGDLWIGTQGNGLLIKDIETGEIKKWFISSANSCSAYIPDNTIWSIVQAGPHRVFAATNNAGVMLVDKRTGLVKSFPSLEPCNNSLNKKNIRSITKVNDSLLFLGADGGSIHLLNTSRGDSRMLSNAVIEQTLRDIQGIKSLYHKNGFLWIGTAGKGLLVLHIKTGRTTSLTVDEGLPNGVIYGIIPEGESSFWMSSNKGLFRLDYEIIENIIKVVKIKSYTVGDGLQSNEFNTGAYHKSEKGTIYFGGINGVNFFHPGDIKNFREKKPVVLTGVTVENNPLETDSLITYKTHIKLPYNKNSISFNYTVLDFLSPETVQYQYKLEGHDRQWIQAGSRQYTAYTNLPPGEYEFKVKAAENIDSGAIPSSLGISISTPYWMEWWFFILIFLVISGALYGFYKYRIGQLLEVQRVKNNISADLHDDIGARLTSIHFLTAFSRQKLYSSESGKEFLNAIDEEVRSSAEALNEIVWNIKMDDESIEDIVAKMRRYAGEVLEASRLDYEVSVSSNFIRRKMVMQKRREIFLVFKELLNNVRKHAEARQVKIKISTLDNMFYLSVQDDGKGFHPGQDTARNGIKNVIERIKKWDGIIKITSAPGQGSQVEIWLPYDQLTLFRRIFGSLTKGSRSS